MPADGLDPALARAIADAALEQAPRLGCQHAEVRVERIRSQVVRLRDGELETTADDIELGVGVRVVRDGAIGFAATVAPRSRRCRAVGGEGGRRGVAQLDGGPGTGRAGRRALARRRGVDLATPDRPHDRPAGRQGGPARGLERAPPRQPGDRPRDGLRPGRGRGHATTPTPRAPAPPSTGSGSIRSVEVGRRRRGGRLRDDAHAGPAGRPGLGVPSHGRAAGTGTPSWRRCPSCWPRRSRPPRSRPGRYDLVIDPTNLWLTIHESIGHATELDRAVGYEAAYAGTSFATFDKLGTLRYGSARHARDGDRTTPHGLATVAIDDEGVARPSPSTSSATASSSATSSTAPSPPPRAGRVQRLRLRRLAAARAHPAHGQRVAAPGAGRRARAPTSSSPASSTGIYIVGDKSWSIDMQRYNFQFTGQRFYRIEDGRLAGQLQRRRLPGHDDRLLGRHGGRRRRVHLRARAVPSTAARASRARSPRSATAARRCSCAACACSTPARSRAMSGSASSELGRDRGRRDCRRRRPSSRPHRLGRQAACIVLVEESSRRRRPLRQQHDHDQRGPTRPPGHGRQLRTSTVPARRRGWPAGRPAWWSTSWSGRPRPTPRRPRRPRTPYALVRADRRPSRSAPSRSPRTRPTCRSSRPSSPSLGRAFARAPLGRTGAGGLRRAPGRHDVTSAPRPGCGSATSSRPGRSTWSPGAADGGRSAWVGAGDRRLRRRQRRRARGARCAPLDWAARQIDARGRPLRGHPAARGRRRPHGRSLARGHRRPGRRGRPHRLLRRRRRDPGRRAPLAAAASLCAATRPSPASSARPSWRPPPRRSDVSVFDNGLPLGPHRLARRRRAGAPALPPGRRGTLRGSADRPRRQPRARAARRRRRPSTTWSPAPSGGCCSPACGTSGRSTRRPCS